MAGFSIYLPMHTSIPISDFIYTGICFSTLLFGMSAILLLGIYFFRWESDRLSLGLWFLAYILSGTLTFAMTPHISSILIAIGINLLIVLSFIKMVPVVSLFGIFFLTSMSSLPLFGAIWSFEIVYKLIVYYEFNWLIALSFVFLAFIFFTVILINTILGSINTLVKFANLYFRFPRQFKGWEMANATKRSPMVSLHVPCYAEPPDLVIENLNALAKLDYLHFEVIVLDNNTKDENLWRPVKERCSQLGERFRFFHVDPVKGAKAGALNEALTRTSPLAEIIGVLDADYVAEPDFLKKLVGFFDDPKTGFVQSCQDFRKWQNAFYPTACYYEYETHFKSILTGQSEWDAAYTVGTMCLIRRDLLNEVGGWSEWCLTEDSEVAVRIHAAGFHGYYLNHTLGFGLIPDTFDEYKKQRFRWTAGAAQQLQKHWRLYLPWNFSSKMSFIQKAAEASHSSSIFFGEIFGSIVGLVVLALALFFAIFEQKVFLVPNILILLIPIALFRNAIFNWVNARLLGGRLKDAVYALVAGKSLIYTRILAFCTVWLPIKLKWHRTNKFKESLCILRAISSCKIEIILALLFILAAIIIAPFASYRRPDLIFFGMLGLLNQAFSLLCAPVMAFFSEKNLQTVPVEED